VLRVFLEVLVDHLQGTLEHSVEYFRNLHRGSQPSFELFFLPGALQILLWILMYFDNKIQASAKIRKSLVKIATGYRNCLEIVTFLGYKHSDFNY